MTTQSFFQLLEKITVSKIGASSYQVWLASASLQYPIKSTTNATSYKLPPPRKKIFVFKLMEEALRHHSVPNKEP